MYRFEFDALGIVEADTEEEAREIWGAMIVAADAVGTLVVPERQAADSAAADSLGARPDSQAKPKGKPKRAPAPPDKPRKPPAPSSP